MKKEFLQETNFAEEYEEPTEEATPVQKALLKKYQQWAEKDDARENPGKGF